MSFETICIRCGKTRILLKTWTERNNNKGPISRLELYVCPDKECQKIVDEKFEALRRKKAEIAERKLLNFEEARRKKAELDLAKAASIKQK